MLPTDVGSGATRPVTLPVDTPTVPMPPAGETRGPQLIHSGPGLPWIPQGQGYNASTGEILTSYNGGRDDGVLLSIQSVGQSPDDASELQSVILGGTPYASPEDGAPPSKGGGVATDGQYVYLADTEAVYVYSLADIRNTPSTCSPPVSPLHVMTMPGDINASYLTVKGDQVYVGSFVQNLRDPFGLEPDETPQLLRFDIGDDGNLGARDENGRFTEGAYSGRVDTPDNAQGVTITDDGLLFTTSYSNDRFASPHHLVFQKFDGNPDDFQVESPEDASKVYDLDYYAEGVNVVGDEVWVTYESGADKYLGKAEVDRDHIQRIPLGELDDY